MGKKLKRRVRKAERRITALEAQPSHARIRTTPLDTHDMWRTASSDFAAYVDYGEDEGWHTNGYL